MQARMYINNNYKDILLLSAFTKIVYLLILKNMKIWKNTVNAICFWQNILPVLITYSDPSQLLNS